MSGKQKIVRDRGGSSNIDLGMFVCYFDVCPASKPFLYVTFGFE